MDSVNAGTRHLREGHFGAGNRKCQQSSGADNVVVCGRGGVGQCRAGALRDAIQAGPLERCCHWIVGGENSGETRRIGWQVKCLESEIDARQCLRAGEPAGVEWPTGNIRWVEGHLAGGLEIVGPAEPCR